MHQLLVGPTHCLKLRYKRCTSTQFMILPPWGVHLRNCEVRLASRLLRRMPHLGHTNLPNSAKPVWFIPDKWKIPQAFILQALDLTLMSLPLATNANTPAANVQHRHLSRGPFVCFNSFKCLTLNRPKCAAFFLKFSLLWFNFYFAFWTLKEE